MPRILRQDLPDGGSSEIDAGVKLCRNTCLPYRGDIFSVNKTNTQVMRGEGEGKCSMSHLYVTDRHQEHQS